MSGLSILAIDDEAPSLDELSYLLERSPLVERVAVAHSATDGLRRLREGDFDAVLLDVRMPGLDGLELAHVLSRFARPPSIVFVTAHEDHALAAFEVGAAGYLLKPVDAERLDRVLRRAAKREGEVPVGEEVAGQTSPPRRAADVVVVDAGTRTLLVRRSDIVWAESAGDYVRLHLRDGGSHLLRTPMAALEEEWADSFVRVHRSYLVSLSDVAELRTEGSHSSVRLPGRELPVSRRHLHELRERLVRWARPGGD